jgi:hypothetical protein
MNSARSQQQLGFLLGSRFRAISRLRSAARIARRVLREIRTHSAVAVIPQHSRFPPLELRADRGPSALVRGLRRRRGRRSLAGSAVRGSAWGCRPATESTCRGPHGARGDPQWAWWFRGPVKGNGKVWILHNVKPRWRRQKKAGSVFEG